MTSFQSLTPPRVCTVEGCEQRLRARGLCNKHYLRMWSRGTLDDPPPPKRVDPRNDGPLALLPDWDQPYGMNGYVRFHGRITRERGRADQLLCVDCGLGARDWSHEHGTWRGDVMNYSPRCKGCHNRLDFGPQAGEDNFHAKLTWHDVDRIRSLYAGGGLVQQEIGDMFGINQRTVSKIVRGERWHA